MIPKQVIDAIKKNQPSIDLKDSGVGVGDIRAIQDFDGGSNRLVLILGFDHFLDVALVTLIHPYTEFATEHDVVVDSSTASVPFDVVVQRDIRASVWKTQIGELAGRLSKEVIDELLKPEMNLDAVSPASYFGSKLTGPFDVRWKFKVSEGQELKNISKDCTSAFIDNKINLQLDDLDVMTAILRAEPNYKEMLICFLDLMQVHGENLRISPDTWVMLEERKLLDEENWKKNSFDVVKLREIFSFYFLKTNSTRSKSREASATSQSVNSITVRITSEKVRENSLVGATR